VSPNLKYGGEAMFFLGIAYRLVRWIVGAVAEGDAPPSAFPSAVPPAAGSAAAIAGQVGATLMSEPQAHPPTLPDWARSGGLGGPPSLGDPALFPPEMLAAMTPEQQAKVIETLLKQRKTA
jgi:hypothetical protein